MLNNEFPPLGGGTATVNAELLRCFSGRTDIEVDLLTSAVGSEQEQSSLAENIRLFRVPVENQCIHHSSNTELLRYSWRAFKLASKLQSKHPYDLCLAWSAVPAGALALALYYRYRLPYFVRVGGPDIPGFERRYRWLYPVLTPVIKKVWQHAQEVIAKCEPEAALIREVDSRVQPLIIRNGVALDTYSADSSLKSLPPRILCVGRLIERKGQEVLLRACAELKKQGIAFRLSLVGTGDSEARYKKLAEELSITEYLEFRGMIPREKMPAEYARSGIFVLPSENEGMSVASLEALASGLPLLLSPTPGTELLLKPGENGEYFAIGESLELAEKLKELLLSQEKREKFSAASRELAQQYQWSEVGEEYLKLFSLHLEQQSTR